MANNLPVMQETQVQSLGQEETQWFLIESRFTFFEGRGKGSLEGRGRGSRKVVLLEMFWIFPELDRTLMLCP